MSTNYYHPDTLEHIRNPLPAVADWAHATALAVPAYDPQTQQCRFVSGAWLVEGVPGKTNDEIIAELTAAVQAYLDAKAREKNYDGILSLCTYATSTDPVFSAEGQAGVEWRDAVWAKCYQVLGDVLAGTRPVPTKEELIAELPAFAGW